MSARTRRPVKPADADAKAQLKWLEKKAAAKSAPDAKPR